MSAENEKLSADMKKDSRPLFVKPSFALSETAHIIRLRGPWQYQVIARTMRMPDGSSQDESGDLPPPGRARMPADWGETLGADFRGRVSYNRTFNRPTGLEEGQRVDLVVEQVDAFGAVTLNGQPLGEVRLADAAARFIITSLLQPHNELAIEVELPRLTADSAPLPRPGREHFPGGLIGEVRLEIFETED
jgi:beta-galactosidase/beta-glucuronidase